MSTVYMAALPQLWAENRGELPRSGLEGRGTDRGGARGIALKATSHLYSPQDGEE